MMSHARKMGRVDGVGTAAESAGAATDATAAAADAAVTDAATGTQKMGRRNADGGPVGQSHAVHVVRLRLY